MKRISKTIWNILAIMYFVFFINMFLVLEVHAYIDPATTAMVTQIVAGVFISIGVAFTVFRHKIVLFFKKLNVKRLQKNIEKQNRKKTK